MAKKRRDDRLDVVQASPAREPGRGTFAVARANRLLAETLPDLVYRKREAPLSRSRVVSDAPAPASSRPPVPPKPPVRPDRPGLDMTPLPPNACKARPESNRSKGGGSRAFVPWCAKKS